MFVRVFDKDENIYYKSIVYATVGIGWFLQYIVLNPNSKTFELVDYLDKGVSPAKPLVEIIQSDHSEFVVKKGAQILKYKHFCKTNGLNHVDVKQMNGYPDVLENYAFLADILINHSVAIDAYKISIRELADTTEWNYILTQTDADDFMKSFIGFHDSTLEKINYSEINGPATANAIFDNSGWFGVVELCFEGIQILKIMPATENYSREFYEASLIVENESVFWADSYMEKPNDLHEGNIIKALNLKWRKL
ncbi:MAG: hypothetical protein E7539_06660 [Ruminococcaceae bacterium]|nr:hypothetical protein [Oscillospiraceae bacterium]